MTADTNYKDPVESQSLFSLRPPHCLQKLNDCLNILEAFRIRRLQNICSDFLGNTLKLKRAHTATSDS